MPQMLWTPTDTYLLDPYTSESDLEAAIQEVSSALFGPHRIYLDIKKKIGVVGKTTNIPDGYLIDLSSTKQPQLYVVENELASHEPLRHVAVQLLQFSLSYDASPFAVKRIIRDALDKEPARRSQCEAYARANEFENLDYLLEQMINRGAFQALVIIDEVQDELQTVLAKKLKFAVEVLTLTRYRNGAGARIYEFEPFLADVVPVAPLNKGTQAITSTVVAVDPSEIDTIVVPAREDGFQETAVAENRWYAVRIHGSFIPKIKYIAVYRIAPRSAITHIASVQSIEPWDASPGKYVLTFTEPLHPIEPIKLVPHGKIKALQNLRYMAYDRLMKAKTLDEAF